MTGKREVWIPKGSRMAGIEGQRERWKKGRSMAEQI
jgi:hypothetical protein